MMDETAFAEGSAMPRWDRQDLASLLRLQWLGPGQCRTWVRHDINRNQRVYGGQLLGQAMAAALGSVPPDRSPTLLQAVFLRGANEDVPIEYHVLMLQHGQRFSSCRVEGSQDSIRVIDVHVSCTSPSAPVRAVIDPDAASVAPPEMLPANDDLSPELRSRFGDATYTLSVKPCLDFRFVDAEAELLPRQDLARVRFWLRVKGPLAEQPLLQSAALAYLSDYWLNYAGVAPSLAARRPDESLYVASLNHSIWFLGPCRADEWLLVISDGMAVASGRALTHSRCFTRDGRLVLAVSQECVVTARRN